MRQPAHACNWHEVDISEPPPEEFVFTLSRERTNRLRAMAAR